MPANRPPRLVVGYDGSPIARAAVSAAARRVGSHGIIWVVHAYHPPPDLYDGADRKRWYDEHRQRGWALLDGLLVAGDTGDADLMEPTYETELLEGTPAEAILSAARAHEADEIVVGSRGLGRVRALLGSVSHELLMIADRPVLVIPAGALSVPSAPPRDAGQTADTRR
ncbi:MAG: universal stress protein [Solirubrobacteraceae bacterium]